ncbi:MAG: ATP-binding protein [Deltaproteobacteria bacterium]
MKRKIVLGLSIYSVIFLLAGVYVVQTIRSATADLDKLITLHQVEILREHYLLQIKRVQSDLTLMDTRYSRSFETVVMNVMNMGRTIDTCFDCHHSPRGTERLKDLKAETEKYKDELSRVLTIRANASRFSAEKDAAFRTGDKLIVKVQDMIAITTSRLAENTQKAMDQISRTKYILYGLVAIGPLVSALLGFIFITGLTRPVKVLVESTRKLKGGDLDHRVVGLKDEFGELASSINEMAGSLKEQMHKMQRTEQLVVVGELAAGLAHEIKNPLAGIKVAMQVLSEEAGLSEEDRGVVKKVGQEVVRLESLMKNFLNFAKPAKPRLAELNVNNLINTILAFYVKSRTAAPERPNAMVIAKDLQPVPETMADPMQLQQIFLNIVLNAVDAMPNGGTLGVRTYFEKGPDLIHVEISDTGKGISREHADQIFQPFFTTKPKGTGLGLAISKQLVEQHGGTISVGSNTPVGTVFRIRIPLSIKPAEQEA